MAASHLLKALQQRSCGKAFHPQLDVPGYE